MKLSSESTLDAVTSLLGSMMFEKTIKAVATNIGDEAVGGWDLTSSP